MELPAALLLSFVAALIGATMSLLLDGGWWSAAIAVAILAIGPILILAMTSRRD